jgi:nascent polypeptide-associated complex subunit alpha
MFGGGGFDPQKMNQMMDQLGIEMEDIDAEEIIIRTAEEDLVFEDAEVQRMDAQGQQTYNIVGEPDHRPRGEGGDASAGGDDGAATEAGGDDGAIPAADVEIVAERAGVSQSDAREALEATDGDLAAAIERLA